MLRFCKERDLLADDTGDLPGNTDNRGTVGPVRSQVDLDLGVAQDRMSKKVWPLRRTVWQFHDALMIFTETEFSFGAEHALGFDSPDL